MKFKILFLSVALTVAFTSCKLEGSSNYTPDIVFVTYPKLQNGDSLYTYYTDQARVYLMDTISVGDTVSFYPYTTGHTNRLTAFYILQSADSVSRIILPETATLDSIFSAGSDYKTGKFLMEGEATSLYFPFKFVAIKPSKTAKLKFTVVSDAKFPDMTIGSNTTSIEVITPIVEKANEVTENP